MRGILSLTRNEIFKLSKQLSNKIFIVIILAIAVLFPIGEYTLTNIISDTYSDGYGYYNDDSYEPENDIEAKHIEIEKASNAFWNDNDIQANDWRKQFYFSTHYDLVNTIGAFELLQSGKSYQEVIKWFWIDNAVDCMFDNDGKYKDGSATKFVSNLSNEQYSDSQGYDEEKDFSGVEFGKAADALKEQLSLLEETILSGDLQTMYKSMLTTAQNQIAEGEKMIVEYQAQYDAEVNVSKKEKIQTELEQTKQDIELNNMLLPYIKYSSENNINASQNGTLNSMKDICRRYLIAANPISQKQFENEKNMIDSYGNYDNYLLQNNRAKKTAENAKKILDYSFNNDIPTQQIEDSVNQGSSKSLWLSSISSIVSILTVYGIVFGGSILTGEYSSGTIRLLLIRPKKRYKILLSKLLCVFCYTSIISIISAIISLAIHLILYGVSDLFTPELMVIGSGVVAIPSVLYAIVYMVGVSLPLVICTTLAFMLATLIKRAQFATAIPMVLTLLSSLGQFLALQYSYIRLFEFTTLPYMPFGVYMQNDFSRISSGMTAAPPMLLGAVVLLVFCAINIFISFIAFNKQQIKN